jgi:xanthine/uracil permease
MSAGEATATRGLAPGWLERFFPAPRQGRRKRPKELVYWLDERPPLAPRLALGLQHALLSLTFCLYAVIAGQGIGLPPSGVVTLVSDCLFLTGLATLLSALRSRFTAGVLMVALPNPVSLGTYVVVVTQYGLGAAMGAILVANLAVLAFTRLLPKMRVLFPPEVIGVVIFMLGLSLVGGGVSRATGLAGTGGHLSLPALGCAGLTLAVIVGLSIWGNARLKVMAVPVGALLGTLLAVGSGQLAALPGEPIAATPLFAVPFLGLHLPAPEFKPLAILALLIPEFISAIDSVASAMTVDRMNDADWRRADMSLASRLVGTFAFVNLLNGAAGALTNGTSSANIGLAQVTGATSRHVGLVAGALLMAFAFLPRLAELFTLTPAPVIGGILVYTAAYMMVAGMDMVLSRMLNERRIFMVGLALVAGSAVMLLPRLVEDAPAWSRLIIESGLTVASLVAITLNALFRIGVRRTRETLLGDAEQAAAADFLEDAGLAWGCRRDVILRAGNAVGEAIEALRGAELARGPIRLAASFDEYHLICTLDYEGRPLPQADAQAPSQEALLGDDEAAFEQAMRQVSATLVARLADQVRAEAHQARASLRLQFEH